MRPSRPLAVEVLHQNQVAGTQREPLAVAHDELGAAAHDEEHLAAVGVVLRQVDVARGREHADLGRGQAQVLLQPALDAEEVVHRRLGLEHLEVRLAVGAGEEADEAQASALAPITAFCMGAISDNQPAA
jgi:hypothetical protein